MAKQVGESDRFVVGFSKKGRPCFFVSHKKINPPSDPTPIQPEDLSSFMTDAVKYLKNPKRHANRFKQRWSLKYIED